MVNKKVDLIVILGSTAVGKSLAAVRIAEALGGEILSADSRQLYRHMNIGTAKPGPELLARVPHHFISIIEPDEIFSAGQYRQMAQEAISRLHRQNKMPVVVGGTGLYIRALLTGLWPGPGAHWDLRRRLMEEERTAGPGYLHQKLAEWDPESAFRIHRSDFAKTVRALEVALLTGVPLTQHHKSHGTERNRYQAILIGLRREREDLYGRINARVEAMIRSGLVEEVEQLLRMGYNKELASMRGLGYRQIEGYLNGSYTLQRAIELLKRDTRRYAKRQMTWFRKEPFVSWIDLAPGDEGGEVAEKVLARIRERMNDSGLSFPDTKPGGMARPA